MPERKPSQHFEIQPSYTTGDLARLFGVSTQTIVDWTRAGRLSMRRGEGSARSRRHITHADLTRDLLRATEDDPRFLHALAKLWNRYEGSGKWERKKTPKETDQ